MTAINKAYAMNPNLQMQHVQCDETVPLINTSAAITAGTPTLYSGIVVCPPSDIAATTGFDNVQREGVFAVRKATGITVALGDAIGWDNNGSPQSGTASSGAGTNVAADANFWIGKAVQTCSATDPYIIVLKNENVEYGTAITAAAATSITAAPAGGTGATEGAYDTAAHRDSAITSINTALTRLVTLETAFNALLLQCQKAGISPVA